MNIVLMSVGLGRECGIDMEREMADLSPIGGAVEI